MPADRIDTAEALSRRVALRKSSMEAAACYTLFKLMTAPEAEAQALFRALRLDQLAPLPPDDAAIPVHEALDQAAAALAADDHPAVLASLHRAIRSFVAVGDAGDAGQLGALAAEVFDRFARQSRWPMDHLLSLLLGLISHIAEDRRSDAAHLSRIVLHNISNGAVNDVVGAVSRRARPPRPGLGGPGLLGLDRPGQRERIQADLEHGGYHVFDRRVPAETVAALRRFAETVEAVPFRDGRYQEGERAVYAEAGARYPAYYIRHQDILDQQPIQRLLADRSLLAVAQDYFGGLPEFTQVNMWWSLPHADAEAVDELAQAYHFDMDWWRFLKFFILLTDVDADSGAHSYVRGSHRAGSKPEALLAKGDYVRITDAEIAAHYGADDLVSVRAPAGTIFAGDTRAWHKGLSPKTAPRLILVLEFANTLADGRTLPRLQLRADYDPAFRALVAELPEAFSAFDIEAP